MDDVINVRDCFKIIRKRWWIIFITIILATGLGIWLNYYVMNPVYEATTTLIVNGPKVDETLENTTNETSKKTTSDDISVSQKLAVTYSEIIKSETVLDSVISNLKLKMTSTQLLNSMTVTTIKDTQIIEIAIENTNAKNAAKIANNIASVSKKEVTKITKTNGLEVIDIAKTPTKPIKPNKIVNVAISCIVGIVIGVFIIFLLELFDTRIKTLDDIEKKLGLNIIGVVSKEY